jgi:hypothetical protein
MNTSKRTWVNLVRKYMVRTMHRRYFADLKAYMFSSVARQRRSLFSRTSPALTWPPPVGQRARKPRTSLCRDKIREYNSMVPAVNKLPGNASPCYNPPSPEFLPQPGSDPRGIGTPHQRRRTGDRLDYVSSSTGWPKDLDQTAGSSRNRSTVRHHEVALARLILMPPHPSLSTVSLTGQPMMPTLPAVYTAASTVYEISAAEIRAKHR